MTLFRHVICDTCGHFNTLHRSMREEHARQARASGQAVELECESCRTPVVAIEPTGELRALHGELE